MATSTDIRQVAVLGATGSIGASALDVIARHPDRLRASVLAAGSQLDALIQLCVTHRPAHAVIADESLHAALRDGLRDAGLATQAHAGDAAMTLRLQEFVKHTVAPYKYPRAVQFVTSLPRTATGKLQRFKLQASS